MGSAGDVLHYLVDGPRLLLSLPAQCTHMIWVLLPEP